MTDALPYQSGPLRGLPHRGKVIDFPARAEPAARQPALTLRVDAAPADEAVLASRLLLACAPPSMDQLDAAPAVQMRQGDCVRPIVVVDNRGLHIIASADAMRRMAVVIQGAGREGAALDLLQAADQAEELARKLQQGAN